MRIPSEKLLFHEALQESSQGAFNGANSLRIYQV
jgi:hypothetical protein